MSLFALFCSFINALEYSVDAYRAQLVWHASRFTCEPVVLYFYWSYARCAPSLYLLWVSGPKD